MISSNKYIAPNKYTVKLYISDTRIS